MDRVLKDYFDSFRQQKKLPPELLGKVEGRLFEDMETLKRWRNWREGLVYQDERLDVTLQGALDECLVKDGSYIPLDYKTKGSSPKQEDAEKYYQNQLDCYCLLLEANQRPTCSLGYLIFYSPGKVEGNGVVQFQVDPIRLETDPLRAKQTLEKAMKLLVGDIKNDNVTC